MSMVTYKGLEQPPALKKKHPSLQNMKVLTFDWKAFSAFFLYPKQTRSGSANTCTSTVPPT